MAVEKLVANRPHRGQNQKPFAAVPDGGLWPGAARRSGQSRARHHSASSKQEPTEPDLLLPAGQALRGRRRVRGGRKGLRCRQGSQTGRSRRIHAARRLSTAVRRLRQDIQAFEQRPMQEPNNPEGFYTIATQYWDQAFRGSGVTETRRRRPMSTKGWQGHRQVHPDQAGLRRSDRLQEPLAPPPGQPRDEPGQAAGAHQAGRSVPRPGRGNSQEEGNRRRRLRLVQDRRTAQKAAGYTNPAAFFVTSSARQEAAVARSGTSPDDSTVDDAFEK